MQVETLDHLQRFNASAMGHWPCLCGSRSPLRRVRLAADRRTIAIWQDRTTMTAAIEAKLLGLHFVEPDAHRARRT